MSQVIPENFPYLITNKAFPKYGLSDLSGNAVIIQGHICRWTFARREGDKFLILHSSSPNPAGTAEANALRDPGLTLYHGEKTIIGQNILVQTVGKHASPYQLWKLVDVIATKDNPPSHIEATIQSVAESELSADIDEYDKTTKDAIVKILYNVSAKPNDPSEESQRWVFTLYHEP